MVVEKNANTNIMSNWRYFYWNLERYINEMGGESTIKYLSRKRTITKYLEIRPNELESTYAKTTGIIASDKEVFSDGWPTN